MKLTIVLAFWLFIIGLSVWLAYMDEMREEKEVKEKAELILDVHEATVDGKFCSSYCAYADDCKEPIVDCRKGIMKGLKRND